MRNFILGLLVGLAIVGVAKEVTGYYYLVYVDKSSYVDKEGFHSIDSVPVPLSTKFHEWLGHEYFGIALTGRCEGEKAIQYFSCDKFQILLGKISK